jgi:hypothetical protein
MRLALVAIAASLALTGCGKKQTAANTNVLDEAVTAEDFATNDATAIDAATGADANMAADVDINVIGNDGEGVGNMTTGRGPSRDRPRTGQGATSSNTSNSAAPAPEAPEEPTETNSG